MTKNRRRHFFINKPLQSRYMFYLIFTLFIVLSSTALGMYFGIWGEVLGSFSNDQVQNDLMTAARLTQYEAARAGTNPGNADFSYFRQAERLSQRNQEILSGILRDTHKKMLPKFFLLFFFIAWGSIFLSHKIAGPIYHLQKGFIALRDGDMTFRVRLRKGDEAKPAADVFNSTAANLDGIFSRLKKILKSNSAPAQQVQQIKEELSKIKTSADR